MHLDPRFKQCPDCGDSMRAAPAGAGTVWRCDCGASCESPEPFPAAPAITFQHRPSLGHATAGQHFVYRSLLDGLARLHFLYVQKVRTGAGLRFIEGYEASAHLSGWASGAFTEVHAEGAACTGRCAPCRLCERMSCACTCEVSA